jgi:hypothetical protein
MTQSLTEALAERADAAVEARDWERDQEAWNLPRAAVDVTSHEARGRLDWDGFLAAYFPRSRRHDLKAIVAYGAYKRSEAGGMNANPEDRV